MSWLTTMFSHDFFISAVCTVWDLLLLSPRTTTLFASLAFISHLGDVDEQGSGAAGKDKSHALPTHAACVETFSRDLRRAPVSQVMQRAMQLFHDTPSSLLDDCSTGGSGPVLAPFDLTLFPEKYHLDCCCFLRQRGKRRKYQKKNLNKKLVLFSLSR